MSSTMRDMNLSKSLKKGGEKMTLAERVVNFRAVNGLSQQEFADRAGVSKSTISHLETRAGMVLRNVVRKRIEYALTGGIVRKER